MCSMFPFRDGMRVLLARCDQVRWLAEDGGGRRVEDIVHRPFETVDASKLLGTPFRQQQHPDEPLLVTGLDRLSDSQASMRSPSCYASNELLLIAHLVR